MVIDNKRPESEKAILIGLARDSRVRGEVADSIEELGALTLSAGATIVGKRIQVKPHPNPAFYIGKGLVEEIKAQLEETGGNCIIFDDPLNPAQQRNLEEALDCKVIDRSILILDIFATRARTAPARLQVELAQLEYTLPRLTGAWVHFSRQYGQIGSKGPGETQLETDRRQVRERIATLKDKLKKLGTQRETQRKSRRDLFKVALVGYTNAGKSTLFNLLTKSDVQTANMLFTTLDSTTRVMSTGYPTKVIFSDTVGFIKKLPHQLVESFKSTLEEVSQANLLLHVVDCADQQLEDRIVQTRSVLEEIGADTVPYLLVYNKIDSLPDFLPPSLLDQAPPYLISAQQKLGISELLAGIIVRSEQFAKGRDFPKFG